METVLRVSAAASLTDAFTEVGGRFSREESGRVAVRFNFGASGTLAQQVRAGAPVDVFAAAAPDEMDTLARAGRILAETRTDFAGNRLVLIAPAGSTGQGWESLTGPKVRRIALGQPDSVPAGRYAKETLTRRRLWSKVQPKLVYASNVRQVLTYVTAGNVDAGFVFATDARTAGKRVRTVATAVPGKDHTPIRYPVAVVAGTRQGDVARRFVAFLRSRDGQAILQRYGFTPPPVA